MSRHSRATRHDGSKVFSISSRNLQTGSWLCENDYVFCQLFFLSSVSISLRKFELGVVSPCGSCSMSLKSVNTRNHFMWSVRMWGNRYLFRGGIIVGRQPKSASLAMFCVCLGRILIFVFEAAPPPPSLPRLAHTHTHTQYLLVFWLSEVWVGFCGLCCQK
jgi:hypothetical protein